MMPPHASSIRPLPAPPPHVLAEDDDGRVRLHRCASASLIACTKVSVLLGHGQRS
jgi:hypothetical protein